jgi:hypothetical protein
LDRPALGVEREGKPPGEEGALEAAREEAGKLPPVDARAGSSIGTLRVVEPEARST